nr:MAG TPA: nucelotide kinase [Caudoviricetes sp.]
MNREQAATLWPILKAYSEGKLIQFNFIMSGWGIINFGSEIRLQYDVSRYRVKPNNINTMKEEQTDRVNHPSYYQDPSGVECITVTRHRDFNIGNAIKYLWRAGLKGEEGLSNKEKQIEDLQKAIFYINDEIKLLKDKGND